MSSATLGSVLSRWTERNRRKWTREQYLRELKARAKRKKKGPVGDNMRNKRKD